MKRKSENLTDYFGVYVNFRVHLGEVMKIKLIWEKKNNEN